MTVEEKKIPATIGVEPSLRARFVEIAKRLGVGWTTAVMICARRGLEAFETDSK